MGTSVAAAAKKPSRGPRPGDDEEDAVTVGIAVGVAAALEYAAAGGSSDDSDHGCLGWEIYDDDDGVAFGGGGGRGGEEDEDEEKEEAERGADAPQVEGGRGRSRPSSRHRQ